MFGVTFVAIFNRYKFDKGLEDQIGYRFFDIPGHKKLMTKKQAQRYYTTVIDNTCELLMIIPLDEWIGETKGPKSLVA